MDFGFAHSLPGNTNRPLVCFAPKLTKLFFFFFFGIGYCITDSATLILFHRHSLVNAFLILFSFSLFFPLTLFFISIIVPARTNCMFDQSRENAKKIYQWHFCVFSRRKGNQGAFLTCGFHSCENDLQFPLFASQPRCLLLNFDFSKLGVHSSN